MTSFALPLVSLESCAARRIVTAISRGVSAPYVAGRAAVAAASERSPVAVRALTAELLVAILLTASALLPLTFLPVIEDAFALPKFVLLGAVSAVAIICLALEFLRPQRSGLMPALVAVPLAAYLAFNAIAFAFSGDHGRSLLGERLQYQGFATSILYAGALCAGALAFRSWSMIKLLLWTITIAGMAVSVYALAQMVDLDPFTWSYGSGPPDRAFSSIGQPNALAAFLVLVIPIGAILLTESIGRVRWLLWTVTRPGRGCPAPDVLSRRLCRPGAGPYCVAFATCEEAVSSRVDCWRCRWRPPHRGGLVGAAGCGRAC